MTSYAEIGCPPGIEVRLFSDKRRTRIGKGGKPLYLSMASFEGFSSIERIIQFWNHSGLKLTNLKRKDVGIKWSGYWLEVDQLEDGRGGEKMVC